ncbi:hypothetical protein TRFO_23352 [Tritrichomonas foetus]|uniref:Uncharacterized protein n=1 Tax=Tritrichomonas foetus TaxID=1144522 RepID=A0A1J4KB68_9EUKA|nr:hypothetical protein TRFO_23352 [Tritrichomonas foetus]|eukprot:OHT08202.1 hypothetical protein TRFO_23352 [Tritrichomonas foetus]
MKSKLVIKMSKNYTSRTIQEQNKQDQRVEKNLEMFPQVSEALVQYMGKTKKVHQQVAEIIQKTKNIKIDRDAKRRHASLICWYCEYWDIVQPILEKSFQNILKINSEKMIKTKINNSDLNSSDCNENDSLNSPRIVSNSLITDGSEQVTNDSQFAIENDTFIFEEYEENDYYEPMDFDNLSS